MPQTRRTGKRLPVKLEAELESVKQLAESHRQKIEAHQHQIALEQQRLNEAMNKAKLLEEKRLKEEKAREKERRRMQEEKERGRKRNDKFTVRLQRDADLPWERMSGKGVCEKCRHHDTDCYRVIEAADTRRRNPKARNGMRVQIGALVYSRCQECRVKDRQCVIVDPEEVEDEPQASQGNLTSDTLGSKKRKRGASPESRVRTRSKMKPEPEAILIERPLRRLPTPKESSPPDFRVIPGSSSHFPIRLSTPGTSQRSVSGSQKLQALEKAVTTIQTEQRATRECLESIMGRLGIRGTAGMHAGGSSNQAKEDRGMSYVSESE
ncbi:hypothetical protein FA13DRAFT_1780479 [Coprinellus micaceus]|uniref:Uncharacterized protein n=1 Tax=Coprinellus micaceus TaxID=71717 RepID=A0A4Y7SDC1_COPMI|nr:hypothetical protein FA13DRAFT_1780479 [Coprinellus micaceus]